MRSLKKDKIPLMLLLLAAIGIAIIVIGTIMQNKGQKEPEKDEEAAIACFLEESEGIESASVKIRYDKEGKVSGVAVICAEARDPSVKKEIVMMLSVLLDVGTNKIYVSSG